MFLVNVFHAFIPSSQYTLDSYKKLVLTKNVESQYVSTKPQLNSFYTNLMQYLYVKCRIGYVVILFTLHAFVVFRKLSKMRRSWRSSGSM